MHYVNHQMNRRDLLALVFLSTLIPYAKAGVWESGSFDNDDALDWAGQCVRSTGAAFISKTLDGAQIDKYLEAPECSAAIAAAEVVAASKGKANMSLPKELFAWLERQQRAEIAKLAPLAAKSVTRILNGPKSELLELWSENKKEFPTWQRNMQDLIARLK